jgi:hypothetical protein
MNCSKEIWIVEDGYSPSPRPSIFLTAFFRRESGTSQRSSAYAMDVMRNHCAIPQATATSIDLFAGEGARATKSYLSLPIRSAGQ